MERVQAEIDALSEILLPNQMTRLTEIYVQVQGANAVNDPVIAKELDITDSQKEEMAEVRASMREKMAELREIEDRAEMREKMREMNDEASEKVMGVLTKSQTSKLAEMKGDKFDMPQDALRGNRRRRGGQERSDF